MQNQVLVIGHTGFIGKAIVEQLSSKKIKHKGVASREVDLKTPESVKVLLRLFNKNTTLIITAALTRELGDTLENMETHIKMISNIARALGKKPVKKCVYLSTCDVYGKVTPEKLPITENTNAIPQTYYAIAKYCNEKLLEITCQNLKIPFLVLRYNGVYGPGQKNIGYGQNFFIREIKELGVVKIWGDGKELRDTVYVKDLAKIITNLSLNNAQGIFNIATGKSYSFIEILKVLKNISHKKFKIVKRKRTSPTFDQVFNISKLKKSIPKIYFTPIEKALEETYNLHND